MKNTAVKTVVFSFISIFLIILFACQKTSIDSFKDKIIYITKDHNNHIAIMNLDGSEKAVLTYGDYTHKYGDISADGSKLVFTSFRAGKHGIFLLEAGKHKYKQLDDFVNTSNNPRFSPDGNRIVFMHKIDKDFEIFTMDCNGGDVVQLTDNDYTDFFPRYSPDGLNIVFCRKTDEGSNIYTMEVDGKNQTLLVEPSDRQWAFYPQYSPDGSKILFVTNSPDEHFGISIMDNDGSNQTRLTSWNSSHYNAQFSPDGSKIVYLSLLTNNEANISIYDFSNNKSVIITESPGKYRSPHFTSDGAQIVFSNGVRKESEIYIFDIDGKDLRQLTQNDHNDFLSRF